MQTLIQQLRNLRYNKQFIQAFKLVDLALKKDPNSSVLQLLHFENHPCWRMVLEAGNCKLTRRSELDTVFIKELYSNDSFLYKFNRNIEPISYFSNLEFILKEENRSVISENNSIFWIIRDKNNKPWGVIGLVDVSLGNKRAETVCGVSENAPWGIVVAANLLLFHFYFNIIEFNKIIAFTYHDNLESLKNALKIGFQVEGHLKGHIWDNQKNLFIDLYQLGIDRNNAFDEKNIRRIKKLLPQLHTQLEILG